jgi:hypothetical protein
MADLDYTNIAGSPFQPYVATQIEKRKALVNKDYRSSSELNWLSNKNVWIRVSSGANVKYGNMGYQGLQGDELSKKYILQGGLLNHLPGADIYSLRSGIGPDGAYGIGGTDFGLTPMPGMTNISIKTGGKLGTLKETTIDFVCHNMEQLNIMEALYMKLGFGLLVEWGHTYYIDNKTEKIENVPQPLPFYGIHTKEELMGAITTHRKLHSGNYDASWGTIKNFTYTLSKNGTFNCQVQLVGAGDILESLKVNISGDYSGSAPTDNELSGSIYPVVSDSNKSLLNGALYKIYSRDVINTPDDTSYLEKLANKAADFLFGDNIVRDNYTIETNINYLNYIQPFYSNINLNLLNWDNNTELQRKGYHYRLVNEPGVSTNYDGDIDNKVSAITVSNYFARLVMDYELSGEEEANTTDITKPGLAQVYITLGNLLLLIKSTGMLYQRNDGEGSDKQRPYIYIDVNPDTNRCFTFQGHCSLDPSICLIGSDTLPFGITSQVFYDIRANFPWHNDNSNLGGRFMWTLVNVDWVASLIKKWRANDKKGNVYFVDLVKDILDGISKATGGYNEFRIVPDDDSRCVRILDDRRMINPGATIPDNYYTEIPVLGKRSIVYDFNYTSKIAPNTAAMIVVAAQAQPYGVQGTENALAFSHLNKGLYNRLDTVVVDSGTESNKNANPNSNVIERYVELRDFIKEIYSGEGGVNAISDPNEANKILEQNEASGSVNSALVKEALPTALKTLYFELVAEATKIDSNFANTEEAAALQNSYNDALKWLQNSKAEDLVDRLESYKILSESTKKYRYLVADILSGPGSVVGSYPTRFYKSPNTLDSDIESAWEAYIDKIFVNSKSNF